MSQSADVTALRSPWGRVSVPSDAPAVRRIAPRDLWFHLRDGEIRIASADAPVDSEAPAVRPPEDAVWSRWATPEGERELLLQPALPDRPVVMEPEVSFSLLPRARARVFVRVPLSIRVEVAGSGGVLLEELTTVAMSDTWWGGFLEGELCYWLPTTARREIRPELMAPHLAVCPLLLANQSSSDLRVEKLAVRMAHLSLFADEVGFWADESVVRYQGESEESEIEMSGRPPAEARGAVKVADARIPLARGFRSRTFARLRGLPGLGGAS